MDDVSRLFKISIDFWLIYNKGIRALRRIFGPKGD
jgi:hypothetical protein